jgi:hypothetical protein
MAGRNDDLGEVRGLLSGAGRRFGSARATVLHKVYADVAEEANRRFVDWRFANGGTGTLLRVVARLEGREFRVAEATEVAYGERLPEGTFRLEIPGVEFR